MPKIEFITVSQMVEHAIEKFPELGLYLDPKIDDILICTNRRNALDRKIRRTLHDYKLTNQQPSAKKHPVKSDNTPGDEGASELESKNPDDEGASELESKNPDDEGASNKKDKSDGHKIAKEIAYFVIDVILSDHILEKIEEYRKQREDELKEHYNEKNMQLNKEQQTMFQSGTYEQIQEAYGNDLDFNDEPVDKENYEDFKLNGIPHWLHKNNFEYHLPVIPWDKDDPEDAEGLPPGFADAVIEKMMLRTLFSHFYEFDEENFRKDLVWRAKYIATTDPVKFEGRYSELTERLENPVGYYVFPKDESERKKTKDEMKKIGHIYDNVSDIIIDVLAKREIIDGHKLQKEEVEELRKKTKKCINERYPELFRSAYQASMQKVFEKYK